jgi:hypothetical protein
MWVWRGVVGVLMMRDMQLLLFCGSSPLEQSLQPI